MDIFIGNMPRNTSVLELRKMFGDAGRNARFRLFTRRSKTGKVACFGHVVVQDDLSAQKVIEQLDGQDLGGMSLKVRPFIHRSDSNERRARRPFPIPTGGINRRRGERRGHY
jgi:RNA recognition motif-containing protein